MAPLTRFARRLIPLIWVAAIALAAILFVRYKVGDLYTVVSESMEPTLEKGDRVWVRYRKSDLERGDLVAFRNGARKTVVKRLAALPADEVLLNFDGDLAVKYEVGEDGQEVLAPSIGPWIPLFDDRILNLRDHFSYGGFYNNPWTETAGYLELDASEIPFGSFAGLLRYRDPLDSGWLRKDGTRHVGAEIVADARVRFDVWVERSAGVLKLELTEQLDRFEVLVGLNQTGKGRVIFRHFQIGASEPVGYASGQCDLPLQSWVPVTYQNRDNQVRLWVGEQLVVDYGYELNEPGPLGSQGERILFGGTGSLLRFRSIRVDRDLHYTARGEHGVGRRLTIPPDHIYVLGDHSEESEDSRIFGPIPSSQVIGKVAYRVFPKATRGALGDEGADPFE